LNVVNQYFIVQLRRAKNLECDLSYGEYSQSCLLASCGSFSVGKALRGVKLATDPNLVPKLRMNGPYHHNHICCACNVHWPCHFFSNRSVATLSGYCLSPLLYVWITHCGSNGKDLIEIFSDATRTTYNALQSNMCELA